MSPYLLFALAGVILLTATIWFVIDEQPLLAFWFAAANIGVVLVVWGLPLVRNGEHPWMLLAMFCYSACSALLLVGCLVVAIFQRPMSVTRTAMVPKPRSSSDGQPRWRQSLTETFVGLRFRHRLTVLHAASSMSYFPVFVLPDLHADQQHQLH